MSAISLYDKDFYAWIDHHVALLKQGKLSEINVDILVDELESMAKRDKRELISHLILLIAHLLKWQLQLKQLEGIYRNFNGSSWKNTIIEQRMQIIDQLETSPSLNAYLDEALLKAYKKAIDLAHKETGLAKTVFPKDCPYSLDELLDDEFYPA